MRLRSDVVGGRALGESVRDRVRLRLPRTLALYQRHLRPRISGERDHIELAEWVARGERLVSRSDMVAVHFDRDGSWFEDPSGFWWLYQGGLSGTGTWAEHGHEFEREETELMAELLPSGGTVVDIGANVGLHCIKLARRMEELRILAFEPVAATVQTLHANLRKNGVADRVEVHRTALSDHEGELRMTATLQITNFVVPDRVAASDAGTEVVPCHRLDDVLDGTVDRIDLIKCDVEGSELLVLRGATGMLERHRPPIFVEVVERYAQRYGNRPEAVFDLLGGLGYRHELVVAGERRRASTSLASDLATTPNFLFVYHG